VAVFVVLTIIAISQYLKKRLASTKLLVQLHQAQSDELEDSGRELIITIRRNSIKIDGLSPTRVKKLDLPLESAAEPHEL